MISLKKILEKILIQKNKNYINSFREVNVLRFDEFQIYYRAGVSNTRPAGCLRPAKHL